MELLDIVDEQGIPTGAVVSRDKAHLEGICHRTAQIWVVRMDNERPQVLVQKRSAMKESYPNCYDTSAAGHIHAGDEPLESAQRELEEELGIHAGSTDLEFQGTHYIKHSEMFRGKMFRDCEVGFVYIYRKYVDIKTLKLQAEEVDSVCWLDLDEILEKINMHSPDCCVAPGGMRLVQAWFKDHYPLAVQHTDAD